MLTHELYFAEIECDSRGLITRHLLKANQRDALLLQRVSCYYNCNVHATHPTHDN